VLVCVHGFLYRPGESPVPPTPVRQSTVRPRVRPGQQGRGVVARVVRFGAAGVVVLSLVDGVFGQGGLIENERLRQEIARDEAALERLVEENESLREETRRLKEDPSAIEDLARRHLGLLKEGELVVILRDVPTPTPTSPPELRQDRKKR